MARRLLLAAALVAAAAQQARRGPIPFLERLAARNAQLPSAPDALGTRLPAVAELAVELPAAAVLRQSVSAASAASDSLHEALVSELRRYVASHIEPAIASLHAHESLHANAEPCFASAAGHYLRKQCCVYYSTLAAAMLESEYGDELSLIHI